MFAAICSQCMSYSPHKYMNKSDPMEKLHLKFCKVILGMHSRASNPAVYSELGRYPLFLNKITLSMKYIIYRDNDAENRLLKNLYANLTQKMKNYRIVVHYLLSWTQVLMVAVRHSIAHLRQTWKIHSIHVYWHKPMMAINWDEVN